MADPISVLGTATGVLSLAIEVSRALHEIAAHMRDAPRDVENFALQLEEVTAIMASVHRILEKEQHLFTPELFKQVHSAFKRFHAINQDIKDMIPAGAMRRASWKSFIWAFRNRKRVKGCMESIEAIKSFVGLVLQLANFAATRNEQVQTPETTPNNQDAKLSTLYSIVGSAVEKNRKVIQRQCDSEARKSNRRKETATQHHLRIQPSSDAVEDAATWLYRLVFLPATQHPSSVSDRDKTTNDSSVITSPETPSFLAPHSHPESDLNGGPSPGSLNGNAPSTSNTLIKMEAISTTCDTRHVINSLLRTWTSQDAIPPALDTSTGNDDFQIQVRKGIEEYNSQDFKGGVLDKKKARKAPQLQGVPRVPRASPSHKTLRRAGDAGNQDVRHETESQWVPVDRNTWQTGRAMTVSSAANTDNLPGLQGVVVPPETQDISSTFSGFTGPGIGRRFSYSQPSSEAFAPRSNSPVSRASGHRGLHVDDASTENGPVISIRTADGTDLNISNANMIPTGALAEVMSFLSSQRNRNAVVLVWIATTAVALKFWGAPGDIPSSVPMRCRMPLTHNITCDVDDLVTPTRLFSGEVVVGGHADVYCAAACRNSLKTFQTAVSSGCGHTPYKLWPDMTEGQSVKEVVDGLVWTQEMLCLQDSMALKYRAGMQASPLGRQRYPEAQFLSVLSACSVPTSSYPYSFTPGAPITSSTTTSAVTATPTCTGTKYTVRTGDTCKSISKAQSMSTDRLIDVNYLEYNCTTLTVGQDLCIQDKCPLVTIQKNQTCQDLVAGKGFTTVQLQSWNPTLKAPCDRRLTPNLDSLEGRHFCIQWYVDDLWPVQTPSPIQDGMTGGCNKFHKVVSGDNCQTVAAQHNITLSDFYAWNPAVGTQCTMLQLNVWVCVGYDARLLPKRGVVALETPVPTPAPVYRND
ncbi:hypothetical protein MFIFM68171_07911 [Madurella fahalii]|uniref:LysM domain-containing protein n=1 Tax=Madurella fahalii TaxID=1157608 RepID=A0ABQ0GIW4_9PEZI